MTKKKILFVQASNPVKLKGIAEGLGYEVIETVLPDVNTIVRGDDELRPQMQAVCKFAEAAGVRVWRESEWLEAPESEATTNVTPMPFGFKFAQAGLCEDEGCDHHGTPHICLSADEQKVEGLKSFIAGAKDGNPKDAVGTRKWRNFVTVPFTVMIEVAIGMLEGARKYGRHNYRVAGVRASVYIDAAKGHLAQWWEGEDIDADSGLSHVTKAICSLVVLRDAMIQDMLTDDRPPKANLGPWRDEMQKVVDGIFERHPNPVPPYTEIDHGKPRDS